MTNEIQTKRMRTRATNVTHQGAESVLHSGADIQSLAASSGAHLYSLAVIEGLGPDVSPERLDSLTLALAEKLEQIKAGNISCLEERLLSQVVYLDAVVHTMTVCAAKAGDSPHAADYWRLALKAQAASARTAATLAVMVNQRIEREDARTPKAIN